MGQICAIARPMTTRLPLASLLVFAACGGGGGGGGDDVTCGAGTMLVGSSCEPTADTTTCGTGTHMMGTMCVPDDAGPAGAPTVTAIDPPDTGISGLTLFTITGTGFIGSNVTSLHVFFGDPNTPECEAQLGAATATTISGEVPAICEDLNVTVTVTTTVGSATIPFHYDALFAADGDGGGQIGAPGDIYLIDPFTLTFVDEGLMTDSNDEEYGLSGIAFDSNGTLWGETTGDSPADNDAFKLSQLVTITFDDNGPVVTPIGEAQDEANEYYITDLKWSGTTLYGLAFFFDEEDTRTQVVVTINTTDGSVTQLGTPIENDYAITGGLAVDGNGVVYIATQGAGADDAVNSTGELDTVNTTTGALTATAMPLDAFGAPIQAMTFIETDLVAVVDLGTYGVMTAEGSPTFFGEQLVVIDPATGDRFVSPLVELPAQPTLQSQVDAIDFPPASFTLGRRLPNRLFTPLKSARRAAGAGASRVEEAPGQPALAGAPPRRSLISERSATIAIK